MIASAIRPRVIRPPAFHPFVPRPVKHVRYPWGSKEKRVTIVAGFLVKDGIVLCADTLYTGAAKVHQTKLFGYNFNSGPETCTLVFALAGHENYGKMAIEDCVEAFSLCPPDQRSVRNVKRLLRSAVRAINDKYVDTRPDAERDVAKFDLIIGAWLPLAGGLRLFKSNGPAVLLAGDYHCTGIGAYLGDYLMHNAFAPYMTMREVILLATQAFAAAKLYDANCGGDTQFMTIDPSGVLSSLERFEVANLEHVISGYEVASRNLLFNIGNPDTGDSEFETHLRSFADEVRQLRASFRGKGFEHLLERLKATAIPEGQANPESTTADPSHSPLSQESPGGSDES